MQRMNAVDKNVFLSAATLADGYGICHDDSAVRFAYVCPIYA
jgi:hypothetical protein